MDDTAAVRWGTELREKMRAAGWTSTALADEVGVTQSMVSYWQRGRSVPEPDRVFAIETALELCPGTLSAFLGYVPLSRGTAASVEEAILGCEDLDALAKDQLIASLRVHVSHINRRRAGSNHQSG